jgi:hypothetical protein
MYISGYDIRKVKMRDDVSPIATIDEVVATAPASKVAATTGAALVMGPRVSDRPAKTHPAATPRAGS